MKQDASGQSYVPTGIAIIGMSGRFPGAPDVAAFWRNLCAGVESISRFSDAELEDAFDPTIRNDPNFVRARAVLDGVELFDAGFFSMHAREAELTDPQHRVFLECAWHALEDGGYDPARYEGAIGVFAGSAMNTYFLRNVCQDREAVELFTSNFQVGSFPEVLGAVSDFLATRVSYKLDLRGPSVTIQSACSTSLVAVAEACQSLLLYQCDMALAGGVSITLPQRRGYLAQEGAMASPTGRCRTFDAKADGTVFGAGAGVVLLKRLEDALDDGDHVYAVIRGSALNNDGGGRAGFAAPSANGQAEVIASALAAAEVDARTVGYVECHGTATPLGDPIEVAGLTKAFRASTPDVGFCALGSVKPNVGHLDAAAGVTGLIKTALALENARLPPTLFFETPNPYIQFEGGPFYVNAALSDWPRGKWPRRAGVSAFGVGGTNAHVVLEEAPDVAPEPSVRPVQTIVVSARSEAALGAARRALADHLRAHSGLPLADVAFTLQVGRRGFAHRCGLACEDVEAAAKALETGEGLVVGTSDAAAPSVAFMFPGQGAQYPGMGEGLFRSEAVFRASMEKSAEILKPLLGRDLCVLLYGEPPERLSAEELQATEFAQPALFAVGYALAKLWASWGVRPEMMIGHSVGEFVAACLAGVFSHEDALALIAARGRLMQDMPRGAMLAVRLPEAELTALLTAPLALAAVNGPKLCVAAGPDEAIAQLDADLIARNIPSRRLHTSHAFHTPMMDPAAAALQQQVSQVRLSPPKLRVISSTTGKWLTAAEATSPAYWAEHCRAPVRFGDGLATLLRDATAAGRRAILLETGPGVTLSTLARQGGAGSESGAVLASLPDASRPDSDERTMARSLAQLWCSGVSIDWRGLHADARRRRVSLPAYPFERSRHWIAAPPLASHDRTAPSEVLQSAPSASSTEKPIEMQAAPTVQQDNASSPPEFDRSADLRRRVAALLENLSGDPVDESAGDTTFLDMGFDSLFLSQVAQQLQRDFKVKLTFRQLLGELSTISALVEFLDAALPREPAPAPAPKPAAVAIASTPVIAPAAAGLASGSFGGRAAPAASDSAVEQIIREQLDAMSRLMAQQLETLRGAAPGPAGDQGPGGERVLKLAPPPQSPVAPAALLAVAPAAPSAGSAAPGEPKSRFEMLAAARNAPSMEMTPAQKRSLAALIERFNARTSESKRRTAQDRPVLADPRVAAAFRPEWKDLVYPIISDRAAGSRIWDVDGNEYFDLVNGYGQTAFGHAPPFVVDAVAEQLKKGFAIGPQAELAGKVAALFSELTGNERVTFCNTGSEAVMAAMRIARTVTGRSPIVMFTGDYHGQFDEVLVKGSLRNGAARSMAASAGIPKESVENMVVLPYGAPESLDWIRTHAEEIAAVMVEPVQSRHPELRPVEFLKEIRKITEASGAALIFDEVVTGFRNHPGGMQHIFGIRADLATYGKVVGGGLPVGVLAGKAAFMDALDGGQWRYGDESYPEVGVTFFAGTFVRHPLVLAAVWAVLNHVKEQGPALQERLTARTAALVERLNGFLAQRGLDVRIETYGSLFLYNFATVSPYAALFAPHMLERGVYVQDNYPCFLTTAHSDEDLAQIAEAFESSVIAMQEADFFPKPPGLTLAADCPLTEAQSEIWLAAQLSDEASCAFNESVTLRLRGTLDRKALATALNQVAVRHDALRGSFEPGGERMRIAPVLLVAVADHDLEGMAPDAAESAWRDLLAADAALPFDLVNGPLIRSHLVKRAANDHALVLTFHHIVADGWSINTIIGEFAQLYEAARTGAPADLPEPAPFARYAEDEKVRLEQDGGVVDAFWLPQFSPPPAPLELPTDRPRPALKTYNGGTITTTIEPQSAQRMRKAAAKLGCTSFAALFATFEILLGRLAGQDEVVVGIPAAGQSLVESESLVGHCVNFLPLRGRWGPATTLAEHLAETRRIVLAAFENQNFTLGTLMRKMPGRAWGGRPLVEASFNLERIGDRILLPELEIEAHSNPKRFANFDLFFNVTEQDGGLRIDCDYNTDLFDAATIKRWIGHYHTLIDAVADEISDHGGSRPIARLPLTRPNERALLIGGGADAPALDPRPAHEIFSAWARETPEAVAAECGDDQASYRQIDLRSNQVARRLAQLGVAPGDFVGLLAERSIDTIVTILGVLKAGAVYVPLDPSYPAELLAFMLQDCRPKLTLGQGGMAPVGELSGSPVVDLAAFLAAAAGEGDEPIEARREPGDLAYVMYTSGSTGRPKGVKIPHRAIVRLVTGQTYARFKADEVFLHAAPLAFDASTFEIWGPLLNGGRIAIIRDPRASLDDIADAIRRHGVTTAWFTAGLFNLLVEQRLEALKPLRTILTGGDVLSPAHVEQALAALPQTQLVNGYGPTENTTFSCCYLIPKDGWGGGAVPIGFPIAHTEAFILGLDLEPVPLGVVGQLCVGGAGLAQGYLNRPELTAEKFVRHPFSGNADDRIYLTGDRARRRADGVIEFLGRTDAQVKINGKRVELEEIENVLRADPRVADALVSVRDENSARRIVAYLKPAQPAALNDEPNFRREILAALRSKLPDHMIPSSVVTLDAFPLTPNGKVDRRKLPAPPDARLPVAAPALALTEAEQTMAQIWRDVLNVPEVGPQSNFFELGGHSLLAMRLVGRVATVFGVKIRVVRLFEAPTLREFTALVSLLETPKEMASIAQQEGAAEKLRQVETRTEYGSIVYIQREGTKTPIIAIHNTLMYYKLARQVGSDRRFIGIKLFDESAPRELPSGTMAEIAADYVRVIRAAQPKGPYILVGLCVAGIIAYEAALQLRGAGEAVPLVVVADTWAPGLEESLSFFKRIYLDKINYLNSLRHRFGLVRSGEATFAEVLSSFSVVRMTRILDLAAWLGWIKPTEQGKDDRDTWLFLRALAAARATSSGIPFDGDLVVFQSEEVISRFAGPYMGWGGLIKGEVHFSRVPGWHEDIFQGEGPAVMAEFLRPLLEKVDAQATLELKSQDA